MNAKKLLLLFLLAIGLSGMCGTTDPPPTGADRIELVVNTAVQQQVIIPITGFIDGVYSVVLESVTGYADGDFEKNNSN